MEQPTYSRRELLKIAGIGALGLGFSRLEGIAEAATKSENQDVQALSIANHILRTIDSTKAGLSTYGYRRVYEQYSNAIKSAREYSQEKDWETSKEYKGLELIALKERADILFDKVGANIIIPGESISIKDMPVIKANHPLNNIYVGNNLFKALEDYETMLKILRESEKKGLPDYVGKSILGEYGKLPSVESVYRKMSQTIKMLMENAPKKYHAPLNNKMKVIDKELQKLNKGQVNAKVLV